MMLKMVLQVAAIGGVLTLIFFGIKNCQKDLAEVKDKTEAVDEGAKATEPAIEETKEGLQSQPE